MNNKKFNIVMHAIDEDLLLEAKESFRPRKTRSCWIAAAAACIILLLTLPFFSTRDMTQSELASRGYNILLPESAIDTTYQLIKKVNSEIAEAIFTFDGNQYIYTVVKAAAPVELKDNASVDSTVLLWNSDGLELSMIESDTDVTLNWYSEEEKMQHTLCTSADTDQLLNTACEVLLLTGLNLANAPEQAENIQYHVFSYENLVVAETTFLYQGASCSYRMAASSEIADTIVDISNINTPFSSVLPGNVDYCLAKVYVNPGEDGKIIWYDVVPGIVYSLTVDNDAAPNSLLLLANELFEPVQGDSE